MPSSYSRWELLRQQHLRQHLHRSRHPLLRQDGPAAVERPATPASSAVSVEHLSLLQKAGPVPAAQSIKVSSAVSAEQRSRLESLCISVTSVDGSLKIPRILRNSVRNAEIPLTIVIFNKDDTVTND